MTIEEVDARLANERRWRIFMYCLLIAGCVGVGFALTLAGEMLGG